MLKIHSAEKHANSNEPAEHEAGVAAARQAILLRSSSSSSRALAPGPFSADRAAASLKESTWKRKSPLGASWTRGSVVRREAPHPRAGLFSGSPEPLPTVPFQQGVLK